MANAGKYSESYTWMKQSTTIDSETGAPIEQFTAHGTLWGMMPSESIGKEEQSYGVLQAQTDATVRLRQYPGISALDRLIHKRFYTTYIINGVFRAENETVCDLTRFETLFSSSSSSSSSSSVSSSSSESDTSGSSEDSSLSSASSDGSDSSGFSSSSSE